MGRQTLRALILVFVAALSLSSVPRDEAPPRPNILFIMSDDHAQRAVPAYGQELVDAAWFPSLDRVAREGVVFRQSFVTNSICAPSRAVMLTGTYSHVNGKIDNQAPFDWDQAMYPELLQEAGYQTALIGKIHLDGLPQGFDYSMVLSGQGDYYNPEFFRNGERVQIEGHSTSIIAASVVDWFKTEWDREKPFAMLFHTKAPHRNWMPETKYLEWLEDREFAFAETFFDDYAGRGSAARSQEMEILNHMIWGWDMKFEANPYTGEPSRLPAPFGRMTEAQRVAWDAVYGPRNEAFRRELPEGEERARFMVHRYLRDYLKTVKSVDDGIGTVLGYLEEEGLLDNTLVIYTSDQGFYLGEHGWYDKRFMYEPSLSTPLLVRYPKEIRPGSEVRDMVLNLDLAPTILDYAGVEVPPHMQGRSWRALAAGETIPWRDAVYYHYYEYPAEHAVKRHYGVRTDRYKLIHFYYDVDEWELYDLQTDPHEMRSVYGDPAYTDIQAALHRRLEELRAEFGDSDELTRSFLPR